MIAIVSELIIIMKEKKEKMEEEEEGWGVAQQTVFVIVNSRPYSGHPFSQLLLLLPRRWGGGVAAQISELLP